MTARCPRVHLLLGVVALGFASCLPHPTPVGQSTLPRGDASAALNENGVSERDASTPMITIDDTSRPPSSAASPGAESDAPSSRGARCSPPLGWDGNACVATTCPQGARFEVGWGCIYSGAMPCWGNCGSTSERRVDRPPTSSVPAFDRGAASEALSKVTLSPCKRPDGPRGSGHLKITFAPTGVVEDAVLDGGPFRGTEVGTCIVGQFRAVRVPSFGGGSVMVGRSFLLK